MVVDYHGWTGDSHSQEKDSQEWRFIFKEIGSHTSHIKTTELLTKNGYY